MCRVEHLAIGLPTRDRPPIVLDEAQEGADRVRRSRKASGTDRLFTPGEQSAGAVATNSGRMQLTRQVAEALTQKAAELGVPVPDFLKL